MLRSSASILLRDLLNTTVLHHEHSKISSNVLSLYRHTGFLTRPQRLQGPSIRRVPLLFARSNVLSWLLFFFTSFSPVEIAHGCRGRQGTSSQLRLAVALGQLTS